jgi:4-hydroxy-tetrahydrodipicolinate synthase
MTSGPFEGVLAPVLTPFDADLEVDTPRWTAFCRQLLDEGCDGLAIFGTTSEANSLSLEEKLRLLEALGEAGVPGAKLMPGTGLCSLPETVRLTKAAVEAGAGGVLLLPPFYYKGVSEEGLYAHVAEVIQRVGDPRLKIYLYHIPPVAQVGWSVALVERLVADFPETVVGLKDSSGDWSYSEQILRRWPGFGAFVGNERFAKPALELGGPGTITATANINAQAIRRLVDRWGKSDGEAINDAVCATRRALEQFPTVPGLKAVMAQRTGHPGWARTRPPLRALPEEQARDICSKLDALGALAAVT